jgi:hypothetical protein
LAVALAGSISQGEESALGLGAWHLTLPISARRQWLVKLAVAAAAALVLGVVLPGVLALATLPEARDALGNVGRSNVVLVNPDLSDVVLTAVPVGAGLWLFFVLSFWAATLLRDTLRAIFMAGLSFAALGLWAALSVWLYVKAAGLGGFETGLLREIFAGWHLPTSYAVKVWIHLGGGVPPPWYRPLYDFDKAVPWALALGVLLVSLVALGQSRHQFRRGQVPRGAIIKCAAVLLAIAALAACCCADFRVSVRPEWSLPHYTQKQMLDMERKIKQYRTTRSLPHYTEKELLESPGGIRITQSEREKV